MSFSLIILFLVLTLILGLLRYSQICICENFVPGAYEKPICNSHFMSSNPFKYKQDDDKSEFNDDYFNKIFKKNLPKPLNDNEEELDLPIEVKVLNWINRLTQLNQKLSNKFEMYEFKNVTADKFIFTLYRPNKDHAKVIEAKIVSSKKNAEVKVIREMKVIGFKNSYDVEATSLNLNQKGYDSLSFETLEDRWRQKKDEKLIPEETTRPGAEDLKDLKDLKDLSFEGSNP